MSEVNTLRIENKRLQDALRKAGEAIHSEYCTSEHHNPACIAVEIALDIEPKV